MVTQHHSPAHQDEPTVILTRPLEQSRRFADELAARFGPGLAVFVSPLSHAEFLAAPVPGGVRTLVFTSENGVDAFAARTPDRSPDVICVGDRTAARARAAGFSRVATGPGDAGGLSASLLSRPPASPVLVVRGREQAHDIAADLRSAGIRAESVCLYRMEDDPPSDEALAAAAGPAPVILPLFSPNAASRAMVLRQPGSRLLVAALSPAVARAAEGLAPIAVEVAERPDSGSMIDAIGRLLAGRGRLEDRARRH